MRSARLLTLVLGCAVLLAGCPPPEERVLVVVPDDDWPLLADDPDVAGLMQASERSLAYLEALPADEVLAFGPLSYSPAELAEGMRRLRAVISTTRDPHTLTAALKRDNVLARSVGRDGRGEVLFTGYYEPVLDARRSAVEPFVHPVYALPDDLVTLALRDFGLDGERLVGRLDGRRVVPYPDREAIDFAGALEGRAEILGYLPDLVEAFFLHVQGSGQLRFPDGERIRVGYESGNGQPYRSIGRLLLDEGLMTSEEMSMQGIKAFLAANPDERRRVLSHNPSYVFFRPLPAEDGPLGCYELPLTPMRSVATDRRLFPAPVPVFIRGRHPGAGGGDVDFARFALNQDTGGAIRGPGRVDLFFGTGDEAGDLAGRTKHLGELYLVLPRR